MMVSRWQKILIAIGAAGAVLTVLSQYFLPQAPVVAPQPEPLQSSQPVPQETVQSPEQPVSSRGSGSSGASGLASESAWKMFNEKFGPDLQADYDPRGKLASIKGASGLGRKADEGFKPNEPQLAIARAKEVLDGAKDLIGLQSGLPLEDPIARGSEASAQVYFTETFEGIPIAPSGTVTVSLGREGELLGLYSGYVSDLRVTNAVKLNVDQGKDRALEAFRHTSEKQGSAPRVDGGKLVIWVSRGASEGRRAYDYMVHGRQVVIDAETGSVLYQRDKKHY